MQRDKALAALVDNRLSLHQFGVSRVAVVNTLSQDERVKAEIGVFVDFFRPIGLFEFARLRKFIEEMVGCSIELGTFDALRPNVRDGLLSESVQTA